MEYQLVSSISHLKQLCDVNGRAEFFIILAGGLCRSWKQIHYDGFSERFDILNEIDDTWQNKLSEKQLHSKTIIPKAIENYSMFFCGYQLWGL